MAATSFFSVFWQNSKHFKAFALRSSSPNFDLDFHHLFPLSQKNLKKRKKKKKKKKGEKKNRNWQSFAFLDSPRPHDLDEEAQAITIQNYVINVFRGSFCITYNKWIFLNTFFI